MTRMDLFRRFHQALMTATLLCATTPTSFCLAAPIEIAAVPTAETVLGLWEQKYEFMGMPMVDRYELKKSEPDGYTGKLTRDGKEISKLEEIKFEGDKISFVARGTAEGTEWKVEFAGTIKGDDIDGKVKISVNDQTFETPWKPKRIKQDK